MMYSESTTELEARSEVTALLFGEMPEPLVRSENARLFFFQHPCRAAIKPLGRELKALIHLRNSAFLEPATEFHRSAMNIPPPPPDPKHLAQGTAVALLIIVVVLFIVWIVSLVLK
jgi:hypothetical protein